MKLKYYWLQFIPLIGIIYVIGSTDYKWSDKLYKDKKYIGNIYDFFIGAFIQSISIVLIAAYFN